MTEPEIETMSQALYDTLAVAVQAVVPLDGGGNAALSALAALLGQVYQKAPAALKPAFLREILDELGAEEADIMTRQPAHRALLH